MMILLLMKFWFEGLLLLMIFEFLDLLLLLLLMNLWIEGLLLLMKMKNMRGKMKKNKNF